MAGTGGVLFGPRGQVKSTYSWNLGLASNNQDEAYALFQGLSLASAKGIQKITIMVDLKNIIRHFHLSSSPRDVRLSSIFIRI